ncbi:MAG: Tm-1-like ATP-binding domain-containing protein [Verrucomicrobiota bacterium]
MATIAVLGTLDSKGREHAFVAQQIQKLGHTPLLVDVGTLGEPQINPDVSREQVLASGAMELPAEEDRGKRVAAMAGALPSFLKKAAESGEIDGIVSLGGGGGTAIATAGMRALPIGFPKLMVSTLASGNTEHYVGTNDIVMYPSIVDVAGLNGVSKMIFTRAAGAICGMVDAEIEDSDEKPIVVASMFGNTTECVNSAATIFEDHGYEVLVFHSTGVGGRTMESLIASGRVNAVFDVTTTEWADELVGGVLSAGPTRLDAAREAGLPAIVAPGCLDMVNFGEPDTVPPQFEGRNFYHHNPQVTLMRTNADECTRLGQILAEKVNAYTAPVTVLLPLKGISIISTKGQPFHDPVADQALFAAIRENLRKDIKIIELENAINDTEFAAACAEALLANLNTASNS